jgi:DNA-binding NtrC family response regulator
MDVARRQLIYVTRDPSETLCARFEERGWHIEIVASARDTRKALRSDLATGGLLDLSSHFESHELAAFESSLTMTNVGWVAATVAGQLEDAAVRRLIRDYCFDYVTLPTSNDRIVDSVGHAYGMVSLHDAASHDARSEGRAEGEMVGSCDAMLALFRSIRKVAMTDAPVFISGESGTGKELTAVAIHERSARRDQPFVAINCGAIPAHLLQSELFGYERGAFTGANQRKIGRVEAANGGTLFLDEIGDLPLESQASLLRFLQERKVERLGGHGSTPVDVRIISATHVDMQTAMIEGRFRADLYHRLCVLQIDEPPLRARGKDIELLAKHMLDRFKKDASRRLRGFSPDAIAAIHNYGWPGNVRELINRVRRAIVMSEGRQITARDLELGEYVEVAPVSLAQAREAAERQAIELALLRHRGRLGDAAHELGNSRVTLYRLLSAHGMRHIEVDAPSEHATRG